MAKTDTKQATIAQPISIAPTVGNVLAVLELPDAACQLARAELARLIRKIVAEKRWTQRYTAEVLGIAPPDVSDLMRGKLARFSRERLERFLNALDMDVRIQVGPRGEGKERASVTVEFVAAFTASDRLAPDQANPPVSVTAGAALRNLCRKDAQ
ncbi:MAG: putative family transcriptional regulator [Capsulimonas sp.]|nr:putative family transcriptional regulator [Capsulimonas sp.]